ncbi:outer membrane protein sypB [Vibrio sp. JCM 19236]|nr:outer membrane protein sypB [Vibrio sp. JCM 19236]
MEYNQDLAMGRAKQVERYLTIFGLSQTASKPKPLGKAFHCIKRLRGYQTYQPPREHRSDFDRRSAC